ncbi:MAG TPA: COX15/CtaA family protein [Mucilaginibacter sp.]|jgi:cytochrome c oxidase assembly protein subunit 15
MLKVIPKYPQIIINNKNNTIVIAWLSIGVGMLMLQILLGGITRLTGSGLSITEWKPLMGALPPLNQHTWQQSFDKYRQIAQFKKINSQFTLADYKSIFFWEWLHREWARLMGLVFIIPFMIFIFQKKIGREMVKPLIILFLLGALQGAIGWIMVQSGLNDTNIAVSHIKLAIHFMCALLLLVYLVWFTLKLGIPARQVLHAPKLKRINVILLLMLFFQLVYGAFMAGTHAALSAPTWPDINGAYIPADMLGNGDVFYNLHSNPITIQFIHRSLAYLIGFTSIAWFINAGKMPAGSWLHKFRLVPLLLVFLQITLGILALLHSMLKTAIYYSVIHQFIGMLLLTTFVITLFLCKPMRKT